MTDGAVGGNTYKCKTEKEMDEIKNKIRNSKLKDKNPNAKKVKCKNVLTNEEHHSKKTNILTTIILQNINADKEIYL